MPKKTTPDSCGVLNGLKVLDMSRVLAGPWCGQMLGDMGAQVIKIERPGKGDDTRSWGPPYARNQRGDAVESAYFLAANRNKRSLAIDISHPQGQQLVHDLAVQADILIENFKVGSLAKYQLDYETLKTFNPGLIYCSITGFGQTGPYAPYPGYDFMVQAMGGLMHITGQPDQQPVKVGVAVADLMTGMYASIAILGAINHRHTSGEGQYIDLSLLDSQVAMLANQAGNYLSTGISPTRLGNAHPNIVPYQVFQTRDSYIIIAVGNDSQFVRLCEMLNQTQLTIDNRYQNNQARVENRIELVAIIQAEIIKKTSQRWLKKLKKHQIPSSPINDLKQVFEHPQVIHRGMQVSLAHPDAEQVDLVANPIKYSSTPISYLFPPPMLAEHSSAILKDWLDLTDSQIKALIKQGTIQQK